MAEQRVIDTNSIAWFTGRHGEVAQRFAEMAAARTVDESEAAPPITGPVPIVAALPAPVSFEERQQMKRAEWLMKLGVRRA